MTNKSKFRVSPKEGDTLVLVCPVEQTILVSMDDVIDRMMALVDDDNLTSIKLLTTNGRQFVQAKFKGSKNSCTGVMLKLQFEFSEPAYIGLDTEVIECAIEGALAELSNHKVIESELVTVHYSAKSNGNQIILDDKIIIVNVLVGDDIYE